MKIGQIIKQPFGWTITVEEEKDMFRYYDLKESDIKEIIKEEVSQDKILKKAELIIKSGKHIKNNTIIRITRESNG